MKRFSEEPERLEKKGRLRSLNLSAGIDLTSNDYLGFRNHPALRRAGLEALEEGVPVGAGGSRLLSGHAREHEDLEECAASFFGFEKTLYFPTGYQANVSLFTTLPGRRDVVLFDSLIHASARDGIQAGKAAHVRIPHNDLHAYAAALEKARGKADMVWIAVESVYSMDGDRAPLGELAVLAAVHGAVLVVDEAHATGVFGPDGRGLCAALPRENLIVLHACGKGLGVAGGLLCAPAQIISYMINHARPFIYSTAPSPLQARLVRKALELCAGETGRVQRERLFLIMDYLRSKDFMNGIFAAAQSQIVPIIIGEDQRALDVARALQEAGYDIRAIRPPTVLEGTARLRLSLHADLARDSLAGVEKALWPFLEARIQGD
ncbi:MAG: 8-amino-7-oxononanoate synthase [Alphaproteobacteria bacterium]|nr:8-amino-7-oxononanoate synthase [Alphaproteobacteria bacterium]